MTAPTPHARAATPPAARGSAAPDADPAGAPHPPHGAPAQSSASSTPLPGDAGPSSPQLSERQAAETPGPETRRPGAAEVRAGVPAPEFPPLREVTQSILYSPENEARGVLGNCLQAAIASALGLDLDAVPHFGAFTWWDAAARLWLRGRCLDWRWAPVGRGLPTGRCVVVGLSPRQTGRHAVVGDGGRIAWDPHPSRSGLTEIQGAYELRRWPGGAPEDEACIACSSQLAPMVRRRERPSGTCSGCGETRALRQDGTVQLHRLWTPQSSGTCSGSHKLPVPDEPGRAAGKTG